MKNVAKADLLPDGSYKVQIGDDDPEIVRFPDHIAVLERQFLIEAYVTGLMNDLERAKHQKIARNLEAIDAWASLRKSAVREAAEAQPPRVAEAAFAWLAPRATMDAQLGDLRELYIKNFGRYGEKRARWLYWLEVVRAITPAMIRIGKRAGLFGLVIDYIRTKLGL